MKKLAMFATATALLFGLPVLPSTAYSCEGNYCEVRFDLTSELVQFDVPKGVQEIQFELAGASGGRGGLGGKVTGVLVDLPESLFVVVGGAGTIGSEAPGGFNGGGSAGGYRSNEGSGGGASDLRTSPNLEDRIVVAGGGGGAGGFSGAPGGPGGGLEGASGQNGQGAGGKGGSQTAGGDPGYSNGGTLAKAGSFGAGGAGGSAANAGGGGGGGGWYGGGGGGADTDNCCSDGGGGGGGSSYASTFHTMDVEHLQGVNLGHGFVVLRFVISQDVLQLTGWQEGKSLIFEIQTILPQELELNALDLSSVSCLTLSIESIDTTSLVRGSECEHGSHILRIPAGALGSAPVQTLEYEQFFDAEPPVFQVGDPLVNHQERSALVPLSIEGASWIKEFELVGCSNLESVDQGLFLTECHQAEVFITVPKFAFEDEFGNQSPADAQTIAISFDLVSPVLELVKFSNTGADFEIEFLLSEPVLIDLTQLEILGETECSFETEVEVLVLRSFGNCGYGEVTVLMLQGLATDFVGNQSPAFSYSFIVEEPVQAQIPVQDSNDSLFSQPVDPSPIEQAPSDSELVNLPVPVENLDSPDIQKDPVATEIIRDTEPLDTESPRALEVEVEQVSESLDHESQFSEDQPEYRDNAVDFLNPNSPESFEPSSQLEIETAVGEQSLSQSVLGPPPAEEEPSFPWLPIVFVGGLALLGYGGWRLSGR